MRMNEDQITEWKESWRDEYLKWLCGFANAQGGVLEIGRNDQGRLVGLTGAERLMEELPNKLRDLLGMSYGQIWCMTNSSSGDRIFCFTLLDFNPVSELHTLNDFGQIVKAA